MQIQSWFQGIRGMVTLMLLILLGISGPHLMVFFNLLEFEHFSHIQRSIQEDRSHSQVVLVGIDEKTRSQPMMHQLFGRWPYRREAYAYLLRFMNRTQPRVLFFDWAFDGGEDLDHPESDQAFVESVQGATFRVLSGLVAAEMPFPQNMTENQQALLTQLRQKAAFTFQGDAQQLRSFWVNHLSLPITPLIQTPMEFYSFKAFWNQPYHQRIERTIPFLTLNLPDQTFLMPTNPLGMLLGPNRIVTVTKGSQLVLGDHWVDFKGEAYPIIRWYGDARTTIEKIAAQKNQVQLAKENASTTSNSILPLFTQKVYPQYPLWEIIRSQIQWECTQPFLQKAAPKTRLSIKKPTDSLCPKMQPYFTEHPLLPETFKDRYIIVGMLAAEKFAGEDQLQTLYGSYYPGPYVQANVLDNYLSNDFVGRAGPGWTLFCVLLMVGLVGWMGSTLPIWFSLLFAIALAGAFEVTTLLLYQKLNLWINWIYPMSALILSTGGTYMVRYQVTERRRQQIRGAFGKYVSPGILQYLEKNMGHLTLGGQRRELTMLFCDIRGFTSFSEKKGTLPFFLFWPPYWAKLQYPARNFFQSLNKLLRSTGQTFFNVPSQHRQELRFVTLDKPRRPVDNLLPLSPPRRSSAQQLIFPQSAMGCGT